MTKGPKKPEHEEFLFEIHSASHGYTFALQLQSKESDPFWEHQTLELVATCVRPDRYSGRSVRLRIRGDRDLAERDRQRRMEGIKGVGYMEIKGARFDVVGAVPFDACWHIGQAVSAGSVRYLRTGGERPYRGDALFKSLAFEGPAFDPKEYFD